MKPSCDFTTPRTLICPISRHFFPVEQPDPVACCTTGLIKGSRLPFIAHFFSSGFGALAASSVVPIGASLSSAGAFAPATLAGLAGGLAAAIVVILTGACAVAAFGEAAGFGAAVFGAGAAVATTFGAATGIATATIFVDFDCTGATGACAVATLMEAGFAGVTFAEAPAVIATGLADTAGACIFAGACFAGAWATTLLASPFPRKVNTNLFAGPGVSS